MLGMGFLCLAGMAITPSEYDAVRAQTFVTLIKADQPLLPQLQQLTGHAIELTGAVQTIEASADAPTFSLQLENGRTALIAMPASDAVITKGQTVRVLARIPADGVVLQGLAVTPASAPAPTAAITTGKPTPSATTITPPPSPAQTRARYVAKVRQIAPRTSLALATNIVNTVMEIAGKHGVDARLVLAVIAQESRFNPKATSPKGAMGLGQLMPGTAALLGVTKPYDVRQNISGTVRYLAGLMKKFQGRIPYVLSAYNAGPGNVQRYGGIPPFAETRHYVRVISNHYEKLKSQKL